MVNTLEGFSDWRGTKVCKQAFIMQFDALVGDTQARSIGIPEVEAVQREYLFQRGSIPTTVGRQ